MTTCTHDAGPPSIITELAQLADSRQDRLGRVLRETIHEQRAIYALTYTDVVGVLAILQTEFAQECITDE